MASCWIDLGQEHLLSFTRWAPDRRLNPQYAHLPDVERYGAIIRHFRDLGNICTSAITFDGPVQRELATEHSFWTVETWEPLTLTPSLLCQCGDHGWIREGCWVPVAA